MTHPINENCWDDLKALTPLIPDVETRVLLAGPRGTGKSRFADDLATEQGRPCYGIVVTDETNYADLIGCYHPDGNGGTVWVDGIGIRAWRAGAILRIDEVDRIGKDGETTLHSILDDPEHASLTLPNGERVTPASGFTCIGTTNAMPDDLPTALKDRFDNPIVVSIPHPELLARLADYGDAVRGAYLSPDSDPYPYVTAREMLSFLRKKDRLEHEQAARIVWGHRSDEVLDHLRLGSRDGS